VNIERVEGNIQSIKESIKQFEGNDKLSFKTLELIKKFIEF